MEYKVYVVSAGRADKLPFNKKQKENYIFCVKAGEGNLYKSNGCKEVYETGKLIESRNFALDHAFSSGKICVQLSDDIKSCKTNKSITDEVEIDLDFAINDLVNKFQKVPTKLMGIPPTSNAFFAKNLISKNTFCIGDLLFIKPNPLRFDINLTLKEDYDYTLQHLEKYGATFRYQRYLFMFSHYTNRGGAVDIRNDEEEIKNIKYLFRKWQDRIKLNKKRKNEIFISWKKNKNNINI